MKNIQVQDECHSYLREFCNEHNLKITKCVEAMIWRCVPIIEKHGFAKFANGLNLKKGKKNGNTSS